MTAWMVTACIHSGGSSIALPTPLTGQQRVHARLMIVRLAFLACSHEGRYEGSWRNAVYSGAGSETFAKGSTYHGEYSGGLRNGWGICR
jgi:hypothetical protein